MDNFRPGSKWIHHANGLLLILTGFHLMITTRGDNLQSETGLLQPVIRGPDFVTVGVSSSVDCEADCESCTYSMFLDGQTAQGQGNSLAFTVNEYSDDLTVTCAVTNEQGRSATTTKKLRVLVGPVNVSISGPGLLNPSISHTYSCHARCRPSCSYSWRLGSGVWVKGQGNVLSVTPTETGGSKTLVCRATNTVSGMFTAAEQKISIMEGPADMKIIGPDVLGVGGQAKYLCTAACLPSCRFVSSVDSLSIRGNVADVTVGRHLRIVTIKCEAQNIATRKSASISRTVQIKDAEHNMSSRQRVAAAALFVVVLSVFTTV